MTWDFWQCMTTVNGKEYASNKEERDLERMGSDFRLKKKKTLLLLIRICTMNEVYAAMALSSRAWWRAEAREFIQGLLVWRWPLAASTLSSCLVNWTSTLSSRLLVYDTSIFPSASSATLFLSCMYLIGITLRPFQVVWITHYVLFHMLDNFAENREMSFSKWVSELNRKTYLC